MSTHNNKKITFLVVLIQINKVLSKTFQARMSRMRVNNVYDDAMRDYKPS